ncbi:hypothetical protein FAP39_00220 [Shimia litoralis]|mgnify:CR=1 FL=1|uniref:Lipoprotein n=1 Tax=Shimia litoralis TaxID=420403 RepID=A0A4U7NBH1_9RHOB|nr:hypothetical protein [Shimia litoralis]TKZ22334.1 hypothetical protein FAP39_00220 [Shimia litoralis]
MIRAVRLSAALMVAVALAACSVNKDYASDEDIRRVAYSSKSTPSLTLYTMVSNDTGQGAHTSLLINASQRVAWDPAGSFRAEGIVARDDVIYGMTPKMVDYYTRFHARQTYHVIIQKLDVSPEVAELALQRAVGFGAVPQAHCARSTSDLLGSLPGFEDISTTFYPLKLYEAFAEYGPTRQELFEYDADDKSKVLAEYNEELVAEQRAKNLEKKKAN